MMKVKNKLLARLGAGITAAICAFTMLGQSIFNVIPASAAVTDSDGSLTGFPTTDTLIATAGNLLGTHYEFGRKGFGNIYTGTPTTLTPTQIRNYGIDCSGLVYYTLTSLGYSTDGFEFENPVPVDTQHWLTHDNKVTITYGTKTEDVIFEKVNVSSAKKNYWEKEDGTTISPGSVVIADKEGTNHAWIYIDEFPNRTAVVNYLISIGVPSEYITEKTVIDYGNGNTHWRIESMGEKEVTINGKKQKISGVVVNNGTDGKTAETHRITTVPTVRDEPGDLVFTKLVHDSTDALYVASYKLNSAMNNGATFQITETSSGKYVRATKDSDGFYTYSGLGSTGTSFTLADDGTFSLNKLPAGNYSLKETKTANGFYLYPGSKTFTISGDGVTNVSMWNSQLSASVTITKNIKSVDGETYVASSANNKEVNESVKFAIKSSSGRYVEGTATTINGSYNYIGLCDEPYLFPLGTNGKLSINKLPYDTYTIVEVEGADGYKLSSPVNFTISAPAAVTKTVTNTELEQSQIEINKFFNIVGTNPDEAPTDKMYSDTEFIIQNSAGQYLVLTQVSSETGEYTYSSVTSSKDNATIVNPGSTSHKAFVSELPLDTYTITELVDTNLYSVDASSKEVTTYQKETSSVNFINTELQGKIMLKKSALANKVAGIKFYIMGTSATGRDIYREGTTDDNGELVIEDIPIGSYTVYEEGSTVPFGFLTCDPQDVTIEVNKETTIEVVNDHMKGNVTIKKSTTNGNTEKISGIEFTLTGTPDVGGEVITLKATTDSNGECSFIDLPIGTYTISESNGVPVGYITAANQQVVVEFDKTTTVGVINDTTKVDVSKVSSATNQPIAGAVLQVIDSEGKVVSEWTSTTEAHHLEGILEAGATYTLHEVSAPEGYVASEDIVFTVSKDGSTDRVTMVDLVTSVKVLKKSELTGDFLAGAHLQILDKNNTVIDEWITDGEAHTLEATLTAGETYYLHEVSSPIGYTIAEDIEFTVSEDGSVDEITMTNLTTKVDVTKINGLTNSPLAGAVLQVLDADGEVIEEWTSTDKAHRIEAKLEAGKSYTLHEVSAPDGFVLAADKTFTVSKDGSVDNVAMVDLTTKVQISKQDITNGEELPGAKLQVLDGNGNVVDEWISTSTPHYIEAVLVAGVTYTLHEEIPADGFVIANDIDFTVSEDGSVDEVVMKDDTTKIEITKLNGMTNQPLSGALLQVIDENGSVVEEWTSTDKAHRIEAKLIAGATYTLHEVSAPAGFVLSEDIQFTVSKTGTLDEVAMTDLSTKVHISKYDITGEKELAGATLTVLDKDGNTVDQWVSGGTTHIIEGVLVAGEEYTLREEIAPDGYVIASDVNFTVSKDGSVDTVKMYDKHTSVKLTKYSELTSKPLAGAVLQIIDENGAVIEEWTSTEEAHEVNAKLIAGATYTLHEESAPDGYVISADVQFTVSLDGTVDEVTMTDLTTKVQLSKQDITNGEELPGASLILFDSEGNKIDEWTSTSTPHYIEGILIAGATYTLHEEIAPNGYVIANDITFTVSKDGSVDKVVMKDDTTKVKLSKQDITTGEELPGASLKLLDEEGNTVDEWVSTSEPHYIEGELVAGKKYTLHEEIAPDGYVIANDVVFTVSEDGSVDEVVMKDDTTKVRLSKQDLVDGKELPGASLKLLDETGNTVDEWVSTSEPHYIEGKLIAGKSYTLVEESSPVGYLLAEAVTFTVSLDGSVDKVVMKDARIKGFISLTKVDKDYPQNKLEGAIFEIYKDVDKDGKYNAEVDTLVGTMTESETGIYDMELEYGYYLVHEKEAPKNFKLDEGYYSVFVEKNGETYFIENEAGVGFVNEEQKGSVKVQKKTEGMVNIAGIKFILTGTSAFGNEVMLEAVTDENGIALFENVPISDENGYTLTEDESTIPYGYWKAEDQNITVEEDKTTETEVFNDEMTGSLKIVKTTSDNNAYAVSGITFTLYGTTLTGRNIELQVTTDENGYAEIENLPIGTYEVAETSGIPVGYLKADNQNVTIEANVQSLANFVNIPTDTDTPQTGNVLPNLNLAIPAILALVSILAAIMLKKKETDE